MALGQSFAIYKLVEVSAKAVCHVAGATDRQAESVSTYAGAYVAYFAAFITVDPAGAAAVVADVVNKNKQQKWFG